MGRAVILLPATEFCPHDGGSHYSLALAYGAMNKEEEISEYQHTIEIDPDFILAYLTGVPRSMLRASMKRRLGSIAKGST